MAHKATVQTRTEGSKKLTTITFVVPGKLKVNAQVNEHNLVEKVESWDTNPVLGDMLTETTYTEYKDVGGVMKPPMGQLDSTHNSAPLAGSCGGAGAGPQRSKR
jgi:hypothetical protein